jgi:cytochrome c oxidase subunit IV
MDAQHIAEHEHDEEHVSMTRTKIWQVFFYLLGITAVEFFIALVLLPNHVISRGVGNFAYVILTLVKAFYIVAYFMHLKFERAALKTGIIVVFVFIIYFIILMLTEGSYLNIHMFNF